MTAFGSCVLNLCDYASILLFHFSLYLITKNRIPTICSLLSSLFKPNCLSCVPSHISSFNQNPIHNSTMAANDVLCCETMFWVYLLISVALVAFAGLMSGLTLGLMSLSLVDLEVLTKAGQPSAVSPRTGRMQVGLWSSL